jgi:RND family efflux transporter MFP subunit
VSIAGCGPAPGSAAPAKSAPAPAKASSSGKEADLATITLTPEAETSLKLVTAPAERKAVPRTVNYGGEVAIPTGQLVSVSSPFTGTLNAPPGTRALMPGTPVEEGQPIFVLVPILSPESRAQMAPLLIEAEGQVKQAEGQVEIARVNLERAETLASQRLGGAAAVIDTRKQLELAETNLKAARNRREVLAKVSSDVESGSINRQPIKAPTSGMLQTLHARNGQEVAAGMILFEVVNLDPVWVRVPVYVGDLSRIATDKDASVGDLAGAPGGEVRVAKPATAPPSGDPISATVNLFYEVENKDNALRPGQRVGVTLPVKGEDEGLVIPKAALLRDIHGGSWVYEETAPHIFTRRRVLVDRIVGDLAALSGNSLKPGSKVVTDGAAELFGAEFGGFK